MLNIITRIIAILVVSLTLSTPVVAEQLKSILDRGEIAIGVPENFPPFGSVGKDFRGEWEGLDPSTTRSGGFRACGKGL